MSQPGALQSLTGSTSEGMPLAYSRAPSDDLSQLVHSLAVANVIQETHEEIECGTFVDNASFRVLLKGHWTVRTRDGALTFDADERSHVLYFGSHRQVMPLSVRGPFSFVSMQLRPGMPPPVPGQSLADMFDRIFAFDQLIPAERRGTYFLPGDSPAKWLDVFEGVARHVFQAMGVTAPHEIARKFEEQLLVDPNRDLHKIAEELEVSRRTLERHVGKAFGMSPTKAVRRARALDMAAFLLGVASPDDEPDFRLRYFDQSHLIHEFKHFFGASPGQLAKADCKMLRIDLEIRQLRRLEAVRTSGREAVPWRDPRAEPDQ